MSSAQSGRWIQTINPATGKPLRRFKASSRRDVEKTVERARKAFKKWREIPAARRAVYLERAAKTLRAQKDKLGRTITLEMGKTIRESVSEVQFARKTKSLVVGDPLNSETDVGPMVREEAVRVLDGQVKDPVKAGAKIELGGERLKRHGFFYGPTILTDVSPDMRVMREETFGPVAPIMAVKDDDEAVKFANMSEFGLGASVWGQDIRKAEKVSRQISTGLVSVNNVVVSDPRMPFGGVKKSGFGRELSRYGLLEFANVKSVRLYEKSPITYARVE